MKNPTFSTRWSIGVRWTALLVVCLALPNEARANDEPFYELYCSYSRNMGFGFELTVGPKGRAASGEGAEIEFTFDAASKGFSSGNDTLRPGQCTWWDRPMKDSEPRKVKLYKQGVKSFRIRKGRDRSYFVLAGPTSERNGRESYNVIFSMPAQEGALFRLTARQAKKNYRGGFAVVKDYLFASHISTVTAVEVQAK